MIAEIRVTPVGSGRDFVGIVEDVLKVTHESKLHYMVHPMGTTVEGDIDQILALVRRCHELFRRTDERVLIELSIDDRRSREGELVRSVERLRAASAGVPLERLVSVPAA